MTRILDMASGAEYRGEELSFPRAEVSTPAGHSADLERQSQLQLATLEIAPSRQPASIDMAGLDIEKLLQSIQD
ncbi:MAG TPA: hypothetical protein ENK49_10930 [Gammaproteobacteria bacterium]|nr:hypothetical protein [Gammaproteobacteria bacterium]